MVPAESVEPCLVAQQRVLEASETTDIIALLVNKNIPTLDVAKHWKIFTIQKHHSLFLVVGGGGGRGQKYKLKY